MKKYILITILLISATFSFAQGGKKFIGIWEPTNNKLLPKGFILFITFEKGEYMFSNNKSNKAIPLEYSSADNTLLGKIDASFVIIRYLKKENHILMIPQTHADPVEFKKTSFSK